jgi:hypothetical protein
VKSDATKWFAISASACRKFWFDYDTGIRLLHSSSRDTFRLLRVEGRSPIGISRVLAASVTRWIGLRRRRSERLVRRHPWDESTPCWRVARRETIAPGLVDPIRRRGRR